ncbi:MAG: LemA family protein [Wujia sp.]
MELLVVIVVILVALVIWYIAVANSIKIAGLKVEEAESGIDVALTKRYDVLTKMLDTVKGYQQHEKTVLTEIVKLRSGMTMAEKNNANRAMDALSKDINILAENYPELRSNTNFIELQKAIVDVEEHLQAARRLYNANVNAYNRKIVVFPNSIVANNMHAVQKVFFEAEEMKRQDVKMEF